MSESLFAPDERRKPEKTSVAIARSIRAAILDGRLGPGESLREAELASELGTSRTPIREALLILKYEGLVDATPNRGATVRSYSADELSELYSLRAVLEAYAAELAAATITDQELDLLEASLELVQGLRGPSHPSADQMADENHHFHGIIVNATRSERLARMIGEVTALPPIYRAYRAYPDERYAAIESDHREICAALRRRDGETAARIMRDHVLWTREFVLANFPD